MHFFNSHCVSPSVFCRLPQRLIDLLSTGETLITALQYDENIVVLKPDEIFMVRVENGATIVYRES